MSNNNATNHVCLSADQMQLHFTAYDSFELLATGGMGAVFRARQISLDRPVAIKVLTHACSSSLQFRKIFKCEAQVMAKLNHSNLASIYDYGEVNGMLYIVMQHIEGKTLHDAANGRAVTQNEVARVMTKVCNALHHAHTAGVLHRDIKPANILINSELDPVVVDFGLAQHSEDTTLKGDTVFGTPGYTAPEVLEPPYKADQRADVYSLGVLMHELLTGELPRSPYLPPSRIGNVDPRYDAVCTRATHPCPAMRYSTAESMAQDLEKILANKPLNSSALMATPTAHPQTKLNTAVTITPAHKPVAAKPTPVLAQPTTSSIPLPSLSKANNSGQHKNAFIAVAACLTFIIAMVALLLSSQNSTKQAPVATGGPIIESTQTK